MALDAAGNLYIADVNNNRIRKVNSAGVISTVAGTGTAGFSGDGAARHFGATALAPAAWRWTARATCTSSTITTTASARWTPRGVSPRWREPARRGYSGDGGAATAAQLSNPRGVALDGAGNLYIADTSNNRIRKGGGRPRRRPRAPPSRNRRWSRWAFSSCRSRRRRKPTRPNRCRKPLMLRAVGGAAESSRWLTSARWIDVSRWSGERIVEGGAWPRARRLRCRLRSILWGCVPGTHRGYVYIRSRGGARRGCASCWRWRRRRGRT